MKTASLLVVSTLFLSLAACGSGMEEEAPGEPSDSKTPSALQGCSISCDDGRTGYFAGASTPQGCYSYAYNFCAPYGGSLLVPGYPGVAW
ncbi:hypothetical protein POL68_40835 [Stigmatella sp. ncwal1]|uniref:Lipoprotein n=1 Tax=Stigmatella ashevillensis TaxID=2995309 RepID=A0ABT5DMI0_9BACT|nr:hypothetical protein [Stigmatella ashevillena]MDC0714866.1 hypothetical protein [Stigmatella ashevillena]